MKTKAPEANPLSFADGLITIDIQERLRWELKDNNFDFNDAIRTINDDNWLLQRARIGVKVKPSSWLTFYSQAQDSREVLSDRADFPGHPHPRACNTRRARANGHLHGVAYRHRNCRGCPIGDDDRLTHGDATCLRRICRGVRRIRR